MAIVSAALKGRSGRLELEVRDRPLPTAEACNGGGRGRLDLEEGLELMI